MMLNQVGVQPFHVQVDQPGNTADEGGAFLNVNIRVVAQNDGIGELELSFSCQQNGITGLFKPETLTPSVGIPGRSEIMVVFAPQVRAGVYNCAIIGTSENDGKQQDTFQVEVAYTPKGGRIGRRF